MVTLHAGLLARKIHDSTSKLVGHGRFIRVNRSDQTSPRVKCAICRMDYGRFRLNSMTTPETANDSGQISEVSVDFN